MKNYKALILSGALLVFASAAADAQIIYTTTDGMTQGQVMMNIYADNARAAAAQAAMSGSNAATAAALAEGRRIKAIGEAKIKSGNVSTTFTPTPAATKTLVSRLKFDETEPQDAAGQLRYVQRYTKLFNDLMTVNNFKVNDSGDSYVFAYALAYAASNDRNMDKAEVEKFRREVREFYLTNPYYQATNNHDRQYTIELYALFAAQAAEQRALYRRATSEAERQKYDEKAKHYAKIVLDTRSEQ